MKLLRASAWLLLAGSTGLSIYGLLANRLLDQTIWTPPGLARLAGFTLGYALLAGTLIAIGRRWLVPALGGLALLYSGMAAGAAATATALLILLAAFSLGRLVWRRAGGSGSAPLVELMLGVALYVSALLYTAWFRIHYAWVYLAVLIPPVILNRSTIVQILRGWTAAGRRLSRREAAAFALLFYTLALHWLMALKPEISSDGLSMHLVLPAQVAFRHWWPFDFRLFVWAVMPAGGDWAFTLAYLPGGEFAARLLNFSFLAVTAAMVARALGRWLPQASAMLVAAMFAATPLVQMEAGNLLVEPLWAAAIVAAVLALDQFEQNEDARWLLAAAALSGFGLAIKFGSISFSLVILALALVRLWNRTPAHKARWLGAAAGLFLAFGCWPYVNAWRLTGNPIFPFLNEVIRSPYFEIRNFVDPRFRTPLSWRTLYDVTFHSHKFLEGQDGAMGFGLLLLLPAAVLALVRSRSRLAWTALAVALAGWVATFAGQAYLRYVFPALPLLALVIGIGWSRLGAVDRRLGSTFGALLLAATALSVYFVSSSSWYHKDFLLNPFGAAAKQAYLKQGAPTRALVERINTSGDRDPRVAFLMDNAIGELRGTPFTNTWHSNVFVWQVRRPAGPVDALELFNHWRITWFIAPSNASLAPLVYTRGFLSTFARKVADSGSMSLWRLRDEYRSMPREQASRIYQALLPPASPGVYDDSSELVLFHGPWIRDRQFSEPAGQTITYCAAKGCTVEFRFHGRELAWIYTAAPNRGQAAIAIDGAEKVVDQYSSATRWRQRVVFPVPEGLHRAVIRILGRKQARAEDCFIDVDAFEVR